MQIGDAKYAMRFGNCYRETLASVAATRVGRAVIGNFGEHGISR